ncbi:TonB-dependent siderophore receptor [Leptolyngbya sp. NK1-12]|nr:TonB-dependent siderophore receptor [Leptolyngbya sp. NK1-12]
MSGSVDESEQSTTPSVPLLRSRLLPIHPIASPLLSDLDQPAITVADWIAQIEASLVQITAVQLEATETGLRVILETDNGLLDVPETRSVGNALIADIPNATIAEEFSQANPLEGIALVSVTSLPGNRVRVAITGTDAPPSAEISAEEQGLVLAVTLGDASAVAEEDAIQVVVTGAQDEGYNPSNASVGTRTDTPLRDIPQSVQVVPQQVLEDRQARSIRDGLENVSGIAAITSSVSTRQYFTARGFELYSGFLVNGIPDPTIAQDAGFVNLERLEVLKGPASALYGDSGSSLGATVNFVTRQPLPNPFYEVSAIVGSFNNYQGVLDFSGPLNDSETVLYRLIAAYQSNETFVDFNETQTFSIAPSLSFSLGSRTDLVVEGDFYHLRRNGAYNGLPAVGTVIASPNGELNRSFNGTGPQEDISVVNGRVGYRLEHRFSDNWELRNAFLYSFYADSADSATILVDGLADDNRTLERFGTTGDIESSNYYLNTDLLGSFQTGTIDHRLLFGFSLSRSTTTFDVEDAAAEPIDIFDPVFDQTVVLTGNSNFIESTTRDALGIYLQDQITLTENLKLLLGGRIDIFEERKDNPIDNVETSQSDTAFSPRVGIVYQPIPPISLYASYARSFTPTIGTSASGEAFEPGRGTQYEIGIRADINGQLSANLAFYDLTRTNVTTTDPDDSRFSVQTGEQKSQGIELDISGEILPGWNIIGGYAYNDARVTEDNTIPVGNRLFGAPEHSFNLWTTYRIQQGTFQGLGFGLGFNYVGETQANLANTIELPSFFRTDAAIFYERDRFRAAVNFRNLFDVEYYLGRGSDTLVYAGEPFTVQGTVSWQF